MGIVKFSDVPPPLEGDADDKREDRANASKESMKESPTTDSEIRTSSSMFDTSALVGDTAETAPPDSKVSQEETPTIEADPLKTLELKPKIIDQLITVFDPEIPVNIYELGLIYDIGVDQKGLAVIQMTLTAPGCPAAVSLPAEVQGKVKSVDGVNDARVDLVWEPPWDKDRMSEAAKLQLGIFD